MARVPFSDQLADRLAEVASDLARRWVERLQERLDERPDNVLPTERLLDDIPQLIRELAAFIRGDVESVSEGVLESVSDLSRLRRSQGFGITELLDEYRLLADLIQDEADRTAAALGEDGDPREVARTMGRVRDGILHIGSLTARAYRRWDARAMRERASSAASFCALFSHELHNSLGAAETAAHVVAELGDSAPERRERLLHLILRSLERGRAVAGQLADFVAPGPLDAPMGPRLPVDMLLGEIIRQYKPEATRNGIELQIEGEPPTVRRRAGPLQLILGNLIDNAIKHHHPEGRRWVRIHATEVEPDGALRFDVVDNGPGLPARPDEADFRRWASHEDAREAGTGLGLAIVGQVVNELGGELRLLREPGGGTRAQVLLPPPPEPVKAAFEDAESAPGDAGLWMMSGSEPADAP